VGKTPDGSVARARSPLRLGFRKIVVCLSPSDSPAHAISIACALVAERRRRLIAIAAVEVALELPLETTQGAAEERARDAIRVAQAVAASSHVSVAGIVLHTRDAGEAIVAELRLQKADLVLIAEGAKVRSATRQLSRTTDYVLNHAPCRVMLIGSGVLASGRRPSVETGPRFRSGRPSDFWPAGEFVDRADHTTAARRRFGA
jgi:nucleotide-binding universal stress UspA family protein